jgi:hypothetical protein
MQMTTRRNTVSRRRRRKYKKQGGQGLEVRVKNLTIPQETTCRSCTYCVLA